MAKRSAKLRPQPITKAIIHDHDYSKIFPEQDRAVTTTPFNIKSEFAFIRQLIKRKEYNEARYRLLKINHPKADEWLDKLNRIDPNYSETVTLVLKPLFLVFAVICLFMIMLYGFGQITVEAGLGIGFLLGILSIVLLSLWARQI